MAPKVKFYIGKVEDYVSLIAHFVLVKPLWKDKIFQIYPVLSDKLRNSQNSEEEIKRFFKKQDIKYASAIKTVTNEFQTSWDKINDSVICALAEITEVNMDEFSEFQARVTLNPVCPRFIKTNSFDIYFGLADRTMKTLVTHELSHFFFFKKINELYPEINPDLFEAPHIIWKLSEIIPAIIFKDSRINKIFEPQEEAMVYESVRVLEIGEKRITDILQGFYNNRIDFKDFIEKSLEFVKIHESNINLIL